jgi:cardiolipin synthase (CMP-forming)
LPNNGSPDAGWRTWANAITLTRLAFIPVFWWLLFGTGHRALAAWLLAVLGATDWIDGYVARRFNEVSTVGKILDPSADRLLTVSGLVGVALAGGVPWWFAGLCLVREILVIGLTLLLASLGAARIDVLWWGKVSTFVLLAAFPLFLLTSRAHNAPLDGWQHLLRAFTWAMGSLGLALSWTVFFGYIRPARTALSAGRRGRRI